MDGSSNISYAPNTSKGLEAILWLVRRVPDIDIYTVCKCLYFADLKHLSRHGRSIFGERYEADTYGPRGEVAYGIMRHRMDEVIALGGASVAVRVEQSFPHRVYADRAPDTDRLSASDIRALDDAAMENAHKDFQTLFDETHAHAAYNDANGGIMDYRKMVQEVLPDADQDMLESIVANARTAVF